MVSLFIIDSAAQDLEPRFLSAIPTGGNFAIASYGYSTGNILIDNSLPIEDLNANLNNLVIAGSYTIKNKLILEGHLISWFFTKNKEFFNRNAIQQKPLISAQIHASYLFKPGIWLAVSFGRSGMGETIVNGIEKNDLQKNSRFGAAFAYRINKNHALKIAYTSGVSTRYGADFNTILLAYQFMWFDKKQFN